MPVMTLLEKDCGPKCRSKHHALQMNVAVTKGNCIQCQIFFSTCHNATNNTDACGRNVLHMAASCGQVDLMKWLLSAKKMDVNIRDSEHGWTCLHRSLFYGQLAAARLLIQHDASLTLRDKEGLTAFDVAMMDRLPHVTFEQSGLQEVYTWGDNCNFTLGHEKEQRKRFPERIDFFSRHAISMKQVLMCKYHSVFLSNSGHVYTCGHGRGGRLGHGNEQTILAPKLMEGVRQEECVLVSASNEHTVMLMQSGKVWSCGLNTYSQLGHSTSAFCLSPKMMSSLKGHRVIGLVARKFHTVLYTKDAVFTFGLNAGQLGHQKVSGEEVVSQPRLVSAFNHPEIRIKLVSASDAATIVATEKGDVYALHEYQCRKIASKWLDGVQLSVVGGNLDHHVAVELLRDSGGSDLLLVLLNSSGNVYCWRSSFPVLHRIVWGIKRPLSIKEVALSTHQLVFVTADGDAFSSLISQFKSRPVKTKAAAAPSHTSESMTITDLLNKENLIEAKVNRIPLGHRATSVAIDRPGVNLAMLQVNPNASITQIPVHGPSVLADQVRTLLNEADLSDSIHDCILQAGSQRVPAHSYILAMKSEFMRQRFENTSEEEPIVVLDKCSELLLSNLVQYFYTDSCDLLTPGFQWQSDEEEPKKTPTSEEAEELSRVPMSRKKAAAFKVYKEMKPREPEVARVLDALEQLGELAQKLVMGGLLHRLRFVSLQKGCVVNVPGKLLPQPRIKWDHSKLSDLCDVWLKTDDNQIIACHKCILVSRVEYFHSMLSTGWIESGSQEPLSLPIPSDILRVVLNYLYSDELLGNKVLNDAELLCNVLVVADQMLIKRLKELSEIHLSALVTLKNACELLEFASTYNAMQLKETCHQFITINLASLLESRSLDLLSDDVIDDLSSAYREMVPCVDHRRIIPYDGHPSREFLRSLEEKRADQWAEATLPNAELLDQENPPPPPRKSAPRSKRKKPKSFSEDGLKMSECSDAEDRSVILTLESKVTDPVSPPLAILQPPTPSIHIRCALKTPESPSNQPDLRNIMKQQESVDARGDHVKSKVKKVNRLSQRERKRLNSWENTEATSPPANNRPPANPWNTGVGSSLIQPFKELIIEQEESAAQNIGLNSKPIEVPVRKLSEPSPSLSNPDNSPWGQAVSPEPSFPLGPSLSQIVEDEKERHAILKRSLNKPLHLIQLEEQAITELLASYRSKSVLHEYVTVERMEPEAASPTWQAYQ